MHCQVCNKPIPPGTQLCTHCADKMDKDVFGRNLFGPKLKIRTRTGLYPGLLMRFYAYLIDLVFLGILIGVAALLTFIVSGGEEFKVSPLALSVGIPALSWLYFAALESSELMSTPGKLVYGLLVTDVKGRPISFIRASERFFLKAVSAAMLGWGFFQMLLHAKRQTYHDKVSGCLVIKRLH